MDMNIDTPNQESGDTTQDERTPVPGVSKPTPPPVSRKRKETQHAQKKKTSKAQQQQQQLVLMHPRLGKLPNRSSFSQYDQNSEEVYCICRKPDTGELMVACDGCDEWYHFKCMKIDKKFQHLVLSYYCPYCELGGKGLTLWKRKCQLSGCFNAISGNESKYCSKEHGLANVKQIMDKVLKKNLEEDGDTLLNKEKVIQLVNYVDGFKGLQSLGDHLPNPKDIEFDKDQKTLKVHEVLKGLRIERSEKIQKKKLLIRARENIKKLNDLLTSEIDVDNTSASNAKPKKSKSRKIEVCGYDSIFRKVTLDSSDLNEENLSSNNLELLKTSFIDARKSEEDEANETGSNLKDNGHSVCLLEKKKCTKHNGWQSMINDEIDLNLDSIDYKISQSEERLEKIKKSLTIKYFENGGSASERENVLV